MKRSRRKIRLTVRTRRGLVLLRSLVIDAADDTKPPVDAVLRKFSRGQTGDFNQAMAWLEQMEEDLLALPVADRQHSPQDASPVKGGAV